MAVYFMAMCVALVAVLVYQHHLHLRQTRERDKEWALERGALLQRIQAPEIAIARHERETAPERKPPRVVAIDDDAAFARVRIEREEAASGGA